MSIRVALATAMLAAGLSPAGSASAGARVRVGVYENEPLVFAGADGEPQGIYIDVLEHIASKEGWTLDYVRGSWEECLGRLDRGEIDVQTSIAWSAERAERYEFSRETVLANWGQVYARKGSGIESVLDLAGKTVAVIAEDIYEREFKQLVAHFGVRCRFLVVADYTKVFAAVAEGDADAGVSNRLHARELGRQGSLERTPILFAPVELRFAAPKGQGAALLATVDRHLAVLKREEGSAYHRALGRWLGGVSAWRLPPWLTWVLVAAGALLALFLVGNAVLGALVRARTAELHARNVELHEEIAERHRAEEEARREARFRHTLVEASPAFFVAIGPDGKTLMMNESMLAALGCTLDDVVGKDYLTTFVPERDRGRLGRVFHRLTDLKAPALNENHIVAKDGRELLVEWHGRPVLDEDDELEYFFGVGMDITERKRAEEALRGSEERFHQVTENAQMWVWEVNAEGLYTYASPTVERVLGYTPAEVVGKRCFYDLFHPEERRELKRAALAAFARKEPFGQFLNRNVHKDGSTVWLSTSGVPVLDAQGRLVGYRGADVDITERVRAEDELRAHREHLEEVVAERTAELRAVNAELEAFAYSVSHDLRAPLRAMEGFSSALLDDYGDRLDDEGRDYAGSIVDAARRMDVLIRDLLAYSRVGRTEMHLAPTSLDHVLEETLMQLAAEVQDSGAEVRIDSPLPAVVAHHVTLVQAVTNLVSNALKFVAPGERPRVRVWAEQQAGTMRLWVEDQGIGIDPEHLERIFTVFERLHGADAYAGTGVGLAIVRRGIERMGGRVGMESEPGKGSRFWIELPVAASPTQAEEQA